jgi:hypothetical protein
MRCPVRRRATRVPVRRGVFPPTTVVDSLICTPRGRSRALEGANGDTELTEGGEAKVSQASADYVRPTWDSIGSMVIGRHLFDMTNGSCASQPPKTGDYSAA